MPNHIEESNEGGSKKSSVQHNYAFQYKNPSYNSSFIYGGKPSNNIRTFEDLSEAKQMLKSVNHNINEMEEEDLNLIDEICELSQKLKQKISMLRTNKTSVKREQSIMTDCEMSMFEKTITKKTSKKNMTT